MLVSKNFVENYVESGTTKAKTYESSVKLFPAIYLYHSIVIERLWEVLSMIKQNELNRSQDRILLINGVAEAVGKVSLHW